MSASIDDNPIYDQLFDSMVYLLDNYRPIAVLAEGEIMNKVAALEYLEQLFKTIPDIASHYTAEQKGNALEKIKESIDLLIEHDDLLTEDTIKLLQEVSLKNPETFKELPIYVAKTIIRIHTLGPGLSLHRILKAVDICIVSTTYRPYENLNEFISKLKELRNFDKSLITNDNFDILIQHFPWGRMREAITYITSERPHQPLYSFFSMPQKIDIGMINSPKYSVLKKPTELSLKQLFDGKGLKDIPLSIISLPELETVVSKSNSTTKQLPYFLKNYPAEYIWRFFIDADRRNINPLLFDEREPGYITSCMRSFFNLIYDLDSVVTPTLIKQIHNDVMKDVFSWRNNAIFRKSTPLNFGFGLKVSPDGFSELESMQSELNYTLVEDNRFYNNGSYYRLLCGQADENFISNKVEVISKAYEDRLKEIPNEIHLGNPENAQKLDCFLRLKNIVLMIQKLERLHPFLDGNCRTFCMLLLNRELMRNGLFPCLLNNPNDFDGLSQNEMITEVLVGQNRYLALCNGAESLNYGSKAEYSFKMTCKVDSTLQQDSLMLVLEAANECDDSKTKNEILEKINNDIAAYAKVPGYPL